MAYHLLGVGVGVPPSPVGSYGGQLIATNGWSSPTWKPVAGTSSTIPVQKPIHWPASGGTGGTVQVASIPTYCPWNAPATGPASKETYAAHPVVENAGGREPPSAKSGVESQLVSVSTTMPSRVTIPPYPTVAPDGISWRQHAG